MKTWIKILLALAVIVIIAGILVYKYVYNKPHPDYKREKAAYTLSVKELYDQYLQNKEQANAKYTGQVLEINGNITRVEEADSSLTVVFVFEQGDFGDQGVRITLLPEESEKGRMLDQGAMVNIKGLCTGYNDTDVVLEKGSLVQ